MTRRDAGLRGAWRHPRWRWLLGGTAVSATAHEVSAVALVVVVLDRSGSIGWVGAATSLRVALLLLLGPVAGAIASVRGRRRLLVGLELGRAVLAVLCVGAVLAGVPIGALVVVIVLTSVTMLPTHAASISATPNVVDVDDLAAAVAAGGIATELAFFVGPAVTALAVGLGGPGWAFALAGILSTVAAAAFLRCGDLDAPASAADHAGLSRVGPHESDSSGRPASPSSMWSGIAATARAIRASGGLMALLAMSASLMFLAGAESVAHVLVARDVVDRGAEWVGVMGATAGGAGVLAAPVAARVSITAPATWWLVGAAASCGVSFAILAVSDSVVVVLLLVAMSGASWMVIGVMLITLLQRWTREGSLAQVLGIRESVLAPAEMAGALAATALASTVGLGPSLGILGMAVAVTCLTLAPRMRDEARRFEVIRSTLMPRVERFRRIALFEGASNAALERLARAAVEVPVRAGDCVIDEGAAADAVYVVVNGTFVATSLAKGELSRMGEDDWFGEIGVIGRQPRTASVHAADDGAILAIDAPTFLAAVGAIDLSSGVVAGTMTRRLARSGSVRAR